MSDDDRWQGEYQRLRAIARQMRRGNEQRSGESAFEAAKGNLTALVRKYQGRLKSIEDLQEMSRAPLAKPVRPLEPPEGYDAVAVFDCGEASFCYEHGNTGHIIDIPWPFDRDHVWTDDCEAAGIRVE